MRNEFTAIIERDATGDVLARKICRKLSLAER